MKLPGLEHTDDGDDGLDNQAHDLDLPMQVSDFNEVTLFTSAPTDPLKLRDQEPLAENSDDSQDQALISRNETWAPFLDLPNDVILMILALLSSTDLLRSSLVNRTAHWLSRIVHIKGYETLLKDSRLWEYLPTIARDLPEVRGKAFISYVESTCGFQLDTRTTRSHFSTLSSTLTRLKTNRPFPLSWNGSSCNDFQPLQALAQTILADYPEALSTPPTTLKSFIECCSPDASLSKQLKRWHDYFRLDTQLSTLMLFLRIDVTQSHNRRFRDNIIDEIDQLINPQYSRHLSGFGLIALNTFVPGIFGRLVREALRLFRRENKTKSEAQRLQRIEALLDRLTEDDLLRFIPPEYPFRSDPPADPAAIPENGFTLDPARTLMIEVIDAQYIFFLKKLSSAVLWRIERGNWKTIRQSDEFSLDGARVIPQILSSPILLGHLGENGVRQTLKILIDSENAINNHPFLWPYLSFELIEEWISLEPNLEHVQALVILTLPELLNKLTNTQIVSIAKHLGPNEIQEVLDSPAFRARLIEDREINIEHNNILLMQLAESSEDTFVYYITKHPFTASLLTYNELIHLLYNPIHKTLLVSIRCNLLRHHDVITKLSSTELLDLIPRCTRAVSLNILTHHLGKFSDLDLIQYSKDCIHYLGEPWHNEYNVLLETLPKELEKRSNNLTSAQWLVFACMHPKIGEFIAHQYLDKLVDSDLAKLSMHYQRHDTIHQRIETAITSREEKREEEEAEAFHEQQRLHFQDYLEHRRLILSILRHEPQCLTHRNLERNTQTINPLTVSQTPQEQSHWTPIILFVLFTLLGILGFSLLVIGIGSAIGIPVTMAITTTLFSFLPWSSALTSCVIGFVIHLVSGFFIGATPEIPAKTRKSNHAGFFGSFDCYPNCSESNIISNNNSAPKLSMTLSVPTLTTVQQQTEEHHDLDYIEWLRFNYF